MKSNRQFVKFGLLTILFLFALSPVEAHDGFYLMDAVVPLTPSAPSAKKAQPSSLNVQNVDLGPYMRELQRRIKMNWNPPKGTENKKVILRFKIAKNGRLLTNSVIKSSGNLKTDKAALEAVKLASPFRPLPADFKGESVDVQFIFDYNVMGASTY